MTIYSIGAKSKLALGVASLSAALASTATAVDYYGTDEAFASEAV